MADVLKITPESRVPEVLAAAEAVLDRRDDAWESRLQLLWALAWRALPPLVGLHLYAADPPGVHLKLAASQGGPAALGHRWHEGLVGTAAADRAVQIVPFLRLLLGHQVADAAALSAIAVPVTRRGVRAVVLATAPDRDGLGVVEAELLQGLSGLMAARWPDDRDSEAKQ